MDIVAENIRDLILMRVAICGEVGVDEMCDVVGGSKRYCKQEISKMVSNGIIKLSPPPAVIRLKKPHGLNALAEKSPYLFKQYMNISSNHNFSGSQSIRMRKRKMGKLAHTFIGTDFGVDFIKLSYSPNNFGTNKKNPHPKKINVKSNLTQVDESLFINNKIKSLDEILRSTAFQNKYFFTSKGAKRYESKAGASNTGRNAMSKFYGVLTRGYNVYPVYYMSSLEEEWNRRVESQLARSVEGAFSEARGQSELAYKKKHHPNGEGVFMTDDLSKMGQLFTTKKKKRTMYPAGVYGSAYLVPLNNLKTLDIITAKNWEEKLETVLFGDKEQGQYGEVMNAGRPIWEMLTFDLGKILKIKKSIDVYKDICLVVYDFQVRCLEEMLGEFNIKFLRINDEYHAEILTSLDK